MIILRDLSKEQCRAEGEDAKVQCVVEWMIGVPLQRVALGCCKDFHTASSFSLVVQKIVETTLRKKKPLQ